MGQTDIGFNTGLKKWFIQGMNDSRHVLGQVHLKDSNITLKNVVCDTYAWADQQQDGLTHGRLRYYDGTKQEIQGTSALAESVKIEGDMQPFKFVKLHGKAILKYNIQNLSWSLIIDGNEYITKNIVGKISGTTQKDKIRFLIDESDFLFNTYITLINMDD